MEYVFAVLQQYQTNVAPVSKVTLDIICETAFGYKTDSLNNPHNALSEAYENLLGLQSGTNIARFILLASIPGFKHFINSDWAYNRRHWFAKSSLLCEFWFTTS